MIEKLYIKARKADRREVTPAFYALLVLMCLGDLALLAGSISYVLDVELTDTSNVVGLGLCAAITLSIFAATLLVPHFAALDFRGDDPGRHLLAIAYLVIYVVLLAVLFALRGVSGAGASASGGIAAANAVDTTSDYLVASMMTLLMVLTSASSFLIAWWRHSPRYVASLYEDVAYAAEIDALAAGEVLECDSGNALDEERFEAARREVEARLMIKWDDWKSRMNEQLGDAAGTSASVAHYDGATPLKVEDVWKEIR